MTETELLKEIYNASLTLLLERIRSGDATAADLAQARAYVTQAGIGSVPTDTNPLGRLGDTLKDLPFPSTGIGH